MVIWRTSRLFSRMLQTEENTSEDSLKIIYLNSMAEFRATFWNDLKPDGGPPILNNPSSENFTEDPPFWIWVWIRSFVRIRNI